MSNPSPGARQDARGERGVGHERQGPRHHHADGGGGLVRLGAELGQRQRPLVRSGIDQDPLRDARVGAGRPGGHGAHVVAAERGGVEEAAQVVTGLR